jgi:hypothetical protein
MSCSFKKYFISGIIEINFFIFCWFLTNGKNIFSEGMHSPRIKKYSGFDYLNSCTILDISSFK